MSLNSKLPLLSLLVLVLMSCACSSNMGLYSRPSGATVMMDGNKRLGQTPILIKENAWVWTNHTFTFKKKGYRTKTIMVGSSARPANMVAMCLTCGLLWPIALAGTLPESRIVRLYSTQVSLNDLSQAPALEDTPRINFD